MNVFETCKKRSNETPLRVLMGMALVLATCAPAGITLGTPATARATSIGPGSVITGTLVCVDGTERFTWQGIPTDGYYQYRDREASLFKFQIRSSDDEGQLADSFDGNWFWMECVQYGAAAPETGDIYNFSFTVEEVYGKIITGTMCAGINNDLTGTIDHHQNTEARMSVEYIPPTGGLQINKDSDAVNITDGNPLYNLAGIEFGIWTDPDCNSEAHGTGKSIVLDADGYGHVEDLPEGTYYIRELESSLSASNYAYNPSIQQATVIGDTNDVWIHYTANGLGDIDGNDVTDSPISDEMNLRIKKTIAESGSSAGIGTTSLAGAKFKVSYFANTDGNASGNADRTWYYLTDEDGSIPCMDESALLTAESSALFRNAAGDTTLPLGTYTIEEIKAPEGYLPATNTRGERVVYKFLIVADGSQSAHGTRVYYTNQNCQEYEVAHADGSTYDWPDAELIVSEQMKRGNVQFAKLDEDSTPLAKCPFLLRALDAHGNVIEQHVVVTDENGIFDSSYDHSNSTNANDAALIVNADGTYSVDSSKLNMHAGVWFGTDANGTSTRPDDSVGALPYGSYDLVELASDVNVNLRLVGSRGVKITHDGQLVNLGTITDRHPSIQTSARDTADGDSFLTIDAHASIEDVVNYENLNPGQSYTIAGKLMDKASMQPLVDAQDREIAAQATFTPQEANGSIALKFDFDARALADDSDIVVFETLTTANGTFVANHEDFEDTGQTIRIVHPNIKTSVENESNGNRIITPDEQLALVDIVSYSGLTIDRRYEVSGVLVDKKTGRAVEAGGQPVTASTSFIAHDMQGTVPVTFTFDSTGLEDVSEYVVFETLKKDGSTLAVHADLHDANQTVTMERPRIGTIAFDNADGDQIVYADTDAAVIDTVSYRGLTPGLEYTVNGTLMDKSTGAELLDAQGNPVRSSTSFVPEASSGSIDLAFSFDASHINAALKAVVFETLSYGETVLATHEDIDAKTQTVTLMQPSISTTAHDAADGDKVISNDTNAQIIDTVRYTGLKAGERYTMSGVIMDKTAKAALKDADGNDVVATTEFTAAGETGSVDITFSFDATRASDRTDLVCFETLTRNGEELADHMDLEDAGQTISIRSPALATEASDTLDGDKNVFADGHVSITDTVSYSGLIPGRTYTVEGKLMDKATQATALDATGNAIEARKDFIPSTAEGSIELVFEFDASHIHEKSEMVAFEDLYQGAAHLASHADINDSSQTVSVLPCNIKTSASDAFDGDKTIMRGQQAKIVDTVTYSNLIAGNEYVLSGKLMIDNGTIDGTPALDAFGVPITSRKAFIASETHGTVDMEFTVDSTLFSEDTKAVVFESLSHDGTTIATHEDMKDTDQTIAFVMPAISTRVSDKRDGDQELLIAQSVAFVDTVDYSGLNSGETYTVTGKLMDKATGDTLKVGGREVTAKQSFVATSDSGSVDVEFSLNTNGLGGKDIVTFEQLNDSENVTLASHEDINATSQTVHVASPKPGAAPSATSTPTQALRNLVKTSDPMFWVIAASCLCGICAMVAFAVLRKRSR